jgi:hypothetical protein
VNVIGMVLLLLRPCRRGFLSLFLSLSPPSPLFVLLSRTDRALVGRVINSPEGQQAKCLAAVHLAVARRRAGRSPCMAGAFLFFSSSVRTVVRALPRRCIIQRTYQPGGLIPKSDLCNGQIESPGGLGDSSTTGEWKFPECCARGRNSSPSA